MSPPPDHAEMLRRADYPVPEGVTLTAAERQLITRFGYWMEALTVGAIAPATSEQERFLQVARGVVDPVSAFEVAWAKARPPVGRVSDERLTEMAKELETTRTAMLAVQQEYAFRQIDILAKVQPEMTALDAELLPKLKGLQAEVTRLETVLKESVRSGHKSFWYRGIRVQYSRGRVTFESKGMQEYALIHPEVNRYRRVGQPVVQLRYGSPDPEESKNRPVGEDLEGVE